MIFSNCNSTKEAIYRKWYAQLAKHKKERENIQKTIEKNLQFYRLELLKKVGPIEKILVNVDGKCYEVDLFWKNIYLHVNNDITQHEW